MIPTEPLKDHIFIDIETIPNQAEDALAVAKANIKAPANYTKQESIDKYIEEKAHEAWLKTSLDGTYGEVIAVTYAFEDGEAVSLFRTLEEDEGGLIADLWDRLGDLLTVNPIWTGHYVADFDLKFLYHRSVMYGLKPSYRLTPDIKPWATNVRDTSFMWTGDARSGIKLDKLALALGLRSPKELADGSEVWDMVQAGEYQALIEYNRDDTLTTREVYKRLIFA